MRFYKSDVSHPRDKVRLDSCCNEPILSSKPKGLKYADLPLKELTLQHLIVLRRRKSKAGLPEAANNRVKALRRVMRFARTECPEIFPVNPALELEMVKHRTDGIEPWTDADVAKFFARWQRGSMQYLAAMLMLRCGLAKVDAIVAGPKNRYTYRGKQMFTYQRAKTSATGHIPMSQDLLDAIEATAHGGDAYLVTSYNKPFKSAAAFGNWFRDACDKAGVTKSGHGLRKKFCVDWAERGCSAMQLMRLAAWSDITIAETYIRKADAKKMAAMAGDLPLLVVE